MQQKASESYYDILNVPESASMDDIKKAYRRLCMKYHPDKNVDPEAKSKFQKISEAYEIIGDNEKRREYDMMNKNPFSTLFKQNGNIRTNMNMNMNMDMDDLFANIFGGFHHMNAHGMNGNPNIRIFHNGHPVMQKPVPIIHHITVPIQKILVGTIVPLDIERWIIQNNNDSQKIFEKELIYINVPKGIDEGELIILKDKGNIISESCKGDIKIFIKIENNTQLKRVGLDLLFEKSITLKDALCGFSFELKYITDKIYTITNNSGNIIHDQFQKIIPQMGFTRTINDIEHVGNLIIKFHVMFPDKISDDVLAILKDLNF